MPTSMDYCRFEPLQKLGCSLVQFLYHQAKAAVKEAAMPVIKANEFQISKAKSQRKVAADLVDMEDL
ncbi:hypothetical protein LC586_24470 [Nostoc sp. CHAB 5714]|uniref:Uncharacterized protein n=1 Tax=Nostoc favosum CHAB5714 TaxID=2780399 RepID=A0ABS8IET1_9NOSO|nr:hypothetical protein [Nostoc favosum CHAB5714]